VKLRFRITGRLLLLLWLAGVAVIWWRIPVGPREGWGLPPQEFACGFLSDSRTIVTVPGYSSRSYGVNTSGPIRLRNVETSELHATYFGADETFRSVGVVPESDLLQVCQLEIERGENCYRFLLLDARTGKHLASHPYEGVTCYFPPVVSPDGRTVALQKFDGQTPWIECRDLRTGQLHAQLPGYYASACFSGDGARLAAAASDGPVGGAYTSIGLWDLQSAENLAVLALPSKPPFNFLAPYELSAHAELLLDSSGRIWDIASGAIRIQSPKKNGSYLLMPDGRRLAWYDAGRLAFYEVETGQEIVEDAIAFDKNFRAGLRLFRMSENRSWLVLFGQVRPTPTTWKPWLKKNLGISCPEASSEEVFILFDPSNRYEVLRGKGVVSCVSPDGRWVLSSRMDGKYELWDIPPRKSLRSFAYWAGAWSALLGICFWLTKRRRAASTS
jgi:WD40 repeat protein